MFTAHGLLLALPLSLATAGPAPSLSVCGTAHGPDGSPLPVARAELLPLEPGYAWEIGILEGRAAPEPVAAAAVEAGRYCLEAPSPGVWKVVLSATGFVPMSRFPLPVTASLELPPVRLVPDVGVRVRVRAAGAPSGSSPWVLAGSADRDSWRGLGGEGWQPDLRTAVVDGEGRARLPRAPGEALDVQVLSAGTVATAKVRADPSVGTVALELLLPPSGRTLLVVDERGEPYPGVAVALAEHGWPVGLTDERGSLTLRAAPSEPVPLLLQAEDGRRRVVRLPADTGEPDSGKEGGPVRIELPPTPAVRGRVVDGERRTALPGALVWLAPDPGTNAVAGPEGEFSLPGGGRDRVRVEAVAVDHLPRGLTVEGAELAAGRAQELALQPAAALLGRVVDPDGRPIEGVTLEAVPEATDGRSRGLRPEAPASLVRSDASGRFRLSGIRPVAAYAVTASRDGFIPRTLPGVVLPPRERSLDLGTVVLRPGVRLEGRVVDGRGEPVEGAEIRLREAGGMPVPAAEERLRERPPTAVTGSDGRFTLPDLAPGRPLDLLASGRGYLPEWVLGVEPPGDDPLTVVLAAASRLSGSLVDPEGVPIPGAQVALSWAGPPAGTVGLEPLRPGSRTADTDARGEFRFDELTPGRVQLFATSDGFLPAESGTLTLPPARELTGVRLVLERGAEVVGRIFDPAGEPVAGAQLRIEGARTLSGSEGEFRIEGVPPGARILYVFHPEYRRLVRELQVEPGANAVDLFLEDGWNVSGRTVDEGGRPVAGARLELRPDRPDAVTGYRSTSDEDGRFRIVTSEEGTFRLTASHDGFAPAEVGGLEVRSEGLEGLDVALTRGSSVAGRILGLAADELAGVTVEARREDEVDFFGEGGSVIGSVDPQGRYAVHHLTPGAWRVQAELDGGRRHAAATVTLDAGTRQLERDLEFGSGLRLTGKLLYGGEPIAGAHVLLTGLTASGTRNVLSGHDGSFRIADLAPGRYRLDVLDRSRALSHVQDLELRSDREIVLELESAPLVGTVTAAETGEPLEDALVYVRKALGATGEVGPLTTVATDAAGGFVLAHVTPGDYVVSARKDGYAPDEQVIRVEAGAAPPAATLRLARAGGVTLTVHLESGGVPRMATVSVFDESGRMVLTDTRSVTDRGFVHFAQIPAGVWDLLVSAPGAAAAWVRAEVPDSAPQVVLPSAAPLVVRVPALMAADAAGTLAVVGEGGEPYFQVDPVGEIRSRWTLTAGLVTVPDLPAGVWTLRVDGAEGGTWIGTTVTDGRTPSQVSLE